jgi:hypothetical protein
MDDFDTLAQAQNHPEALWAGTDKIVLDEVQKAPELLPVIKQAVDNQPGRFRFILSGSANLLLMRQVSESLAGRAIYFIPLDAYNRLTDFQPHKPTTKRRLHRSKKVEPPFI